jgi:hypothetical protein
MSLLPRNLNAAEIDAAILSACIAAGHGKSVSPDDIAKQLDREHWRTQLTKIRASARALASVGSIEILRKGKPIAPALARGVIRLRLSM